MSAKPGTLRFSRNDECVDADKDYNNENNGGWGNCSIHTGVQRIEDAQPTDAQN